MGDYDIVIDGISLKAKVVDSIKILDELITSYFDGQDVLGIDFKLFIKDNHSDLSLSSDSIQMLVISSATRSLVIHDEIFLYGGIPKSLKKFLEDPNICFVRPSIKRPDTNRFIRLLHDGVACCELACRVLKKSAGLEGSALRVIASEVGITYQDVYASSSQVINVKPYVQKNESMLVDSKYFGNVLTQEQVKMVVYDAFKCYQIAFKLLSSSLK